MGSISCLTFSDHSTARSAWGQKSTPHEDVQSPGPRAAERKDTQLCEEPPTAGGAVTAGQTDPGAQWGAQSQSSPEAEEDSVWTEAQRG